MVKIIDQELILLALCKVVWDQSQKTPLEQYARPVRPILNSGDMHSASFKNVSNSGGNSMKMTQFPSRIGNIRKESKCL